MNHPENWDAPPYLTVSQLADAFAVLEEGTLQRVDQVHIPSSDVETFLAKIGNREVDTLGILPHGKFQGWWDPQEFDREALRLLGKWI